MAKSQIEFLRKRDFAERKKAEDFFITPEAEKKLINFKDDDEIIAIEFSINSPATVNDILKIEDGDVLRFMTGRFLKEGITEEQLNESFKQFEC